MSDFALLFFTVCSFYVTLPHVISPVNIDS